MKQYKVEFIRRTAEQINGNQPYEAVPNMAEYVTADSAEEAIELVKQHIIDNCDIVNNDADTITVDNCGEAEEFYGFTAGIN